MPNLREETAVFIACAATGPAASAPDPSPANRLVLGLPLLLGTITGPIISNILSVPVFMLMLLLTSLITRIHRDAGGWPAAAVRIASVGFRALPWGYLL